MQTLSPPNLLTLPTELRHQIYSYVFSNPILHPFAPNAYHSRNCELCQQNHQKSPIDLYSTVFPILLTCKQIQAEAAPIFYNTLTLALSDPVTIEKIHKSTPLHLRSRTTKLNLTLHLSDDTRLSWLTALHLVPSAFPSLTRLTINNHMRPPSSYDKLVDAIYLCAPLLSFPAPLQHSPGLNLTFSYQRHETMFESPLLGEITTTDSIDAHEAVVRDLLADEEFRMAARRPEGDFDVMTNRLLVVARGHEERWLEGLQRRRIGHLTPREVQERVARAMGVEVGDEEDVEDGQEVNWGEYGEDEEVWEE